MIPLRRGQGQDLESPRGRPGHDITCCVKALRRRPWILLELAGAGLLIAWRCAAPTWHPFYLDFLFYLGLFWVLLALCPDGRAHQWAAIGLTLFFLAIYVKGIMPHVLYVAELLP